MEFLEFIPTVAKKVLIKFAFSLSHYMIVFNPLIAMLRFQHVMVAFGGFFGTSVFTTLYQKGFLNWNRLSHSFKFHVFHFRNVYVALYFTILSLTLLFVALFHGTKWCWYQRNRKTVSENNFRVIRVLLQSLDYALMLTCAQATLVLKIKCKENRMRALHFRQHYECNSVWLDLIRPMVYVQWDSN